MFTNAKVITMDNVQETSAQETSAQETSAQETSAQETSAQETSTQETSAEETVESKSDNESKETADAAASQFGTELIIEEGLKIPEINYDDFRPILDFENVLDDEITETACNKLLQDSYFSFEGMPLVAMFLWAYNEAQKDVNFAKQICYKSKSFVKAVKYFHEQLERFRSDVPIFGRSSLGIGLDHRQIFEIFKEYFFLDDFEIAKREAEAMAIAEKKRKERAAAAKNKTKKPAKSSKAKKDTEKSSKPKAKAKKGKEEPSAQIDLFASLGGI